MSKCSYCGSSGFGKPCVYNPGNPHIHTDAQGCIYCGSSAYGGNCVHGPDRVHVHLGKGGCIYCGSKLLGFGCVNNPHGKTHVHGNIVASLPSPITPASSPENSTLSRTVEKNTRLQNIDYTPSDSAREKGARAFVWIVLAIVLACIAESRYKHVPYFVNNPQHLSFASILTGIIVCLALSSISTHASTKISWTQLGSVIIWATVFLGAYFLYKTVGDFSYKEIVFSAGSLCLGFFGSKVASKHVGLLIKLLFIFALAAIIILIFALLIKRYIV